MYLGSWAIDDYLTFPANTHDASTGAATDADSAPSYRVYEDETGTAILTGTMALLDDANTTGFYSERIQLTAGNGFEVGKTYTIYVAATVDSITGTMSHSFQIEANVRLSAARMNQIADHIIRRTFENACDSSDGDTKSLRSLLGAIAKLVNRVAIVSGTLTVYEDDDVTVLGTQTVTSSAGADPITELDTV